MKSIYQILMVSMLGLILSSCQETANAPVQEEESTSEIDALLGKYTEFTLTADISDLSDNQKQMIPLILEAARIMDTIFWMEAYGNPDSLLASIDDPDKREYARINYGPWDRLNGNQPWLEGFGEKPKGANYYPEDMTKEEFENAELEDKTSLYTMIRRGADGNLTAIPYHIFFNDKVMRASELLAKAAELAEDDGLKKYLELRSQALLDDNYQPSDLAWLDMKNNRIDVVIGPIETYEDQLFGYKAAHEAYLLLKDVEWSKKLERFGAFLPELQENLPVPEAYKKETPGTDTELNAYDVLYYAGDCNAGSKTIAINLPNDEEVQLAKGTRRLQLKNAMRAKFDKILLPIAEELIDPEQRKMINFDAFFTNTMFHEVAHGLGIKNTITGKGTVRTALKEHASALEEGKADVLGLYMINQLHEKGEIQGDLKAYHITFMASIFRSIRFGSSSAHGKANMIRFNYFMEKGALDRDQESGTYKINFEKFQEATDSLSELILTLQGDGDYEGAAELVDTKARIKDQLQADLDRLAAKSIPVDVVFNQGADVLGL